MRKWIEFNIKNPKTVLFTTLLLTVFFALGLPKIHFDPSTRVLMPESDPYFLMSERAKHVFGDSRTFLIASIEPRNQDTPLFSTAIFQHLNELDLELQEYKDFDPKKEDTRLNALLAISGVEPEATDPKLQESNTDKVESPTPAEDDLDSEILEESSEPSVEETTSTEEENLDAEILEGSKAESTDTKPQDNPDEDVWDLNKPFHEDGYAKFARERRSYNYDSYKPVTLQQIREALDADANRPLTTALRMIGLQEKKEPLTKSEFEDLLETWETMYLYKSAEIVKYLMDPISGEDILGTKDELKPVDLLPKDENGHHILPKTKKDFEVLKKKLLKNPQFKSVLYAKNEDGSIRALGLTIILRTLERYETVRNLMWHTVMKYDKEPARIYFIGSLIFNKFMTEFQQADLRTFLPLVILVIILTFYFNFRSIRGLVLPTATVILGSVWTVGMMGWLGVKLTMIGTILPPLLIAVGSSYSIHIFNQYMQELENLHSGDKKVILEDSMTHISTTVMLAGFTTFVSFLTLLLNDVTGLQSFGLFAAIGTLLSVVLAVSLIPSSLMLMKVLPLKDVAEKEVQRGQGNALIRGILHIVSELSVTHSKIVMALAIIAVLIFGYGVTKVKTETSPVTFFKEGTYIRHASTYIGNIFDGSYILNVIFDSGKINGVHDPEFLKYIEKLRHFIRQKEQREDYNMLHTSTFNDFIMRMNMAMHGDKREYYRIPDKRETIEDYLEIFSDEDEDSDGRIDSFERTVDREFRRVNLSVRLGERNGRDIGTELSRAAMSRIRWFLDQQPNPNNYKAMIVGEPVNFVRLGDYIVSGQIKSIIMSIFIVAIVIFLLFRNYAAGLTAVIPISISIIFVFGAMGYLGIPLDIAQAILSSIAIGIGVDDTIHFLNTLRRNLKKGKDIDSAIRATHREAGLAIIYTSVALIFGFSVLMLSNFKPIFYFGFLVSSVMAATTIGALIGLPAVIHALNLDISKEKQSKFLDKINLQRFLE